MNRSQTLENKVFKTALKAIPGILLLFWALLLPQESAQAALRLSWLNPTVPMMANAGFAVVGPNEFYSSSYYFAHYQDGNFTWFPSPNEYLGAISYENDTAWFLGNQDIYYWTKGDKPRTFTRNPMQFQMDIEALSNGTIVVCGYQAIYLWRNGQWERHTPAQNSDTTYYDIQEIPGSGFIVGGDTGIFIYDGSTWTSHSVCRPVTSVDYHSPTDIWAVGKDRVLHYDGNWTCIYDPLLWGYEQKWIQVMPTGEIYVTDGGRLLYAPSIHMPFQIIYFPDVLGYLYQYSHFIRSNYELWLVSRHGPILKQQGTEKTTAPFTKFYNYLTALGGESADDFWVGGDFRMYHYSRGQWEEVLTGCGFDSLPIYEDMEYLAPDDIYVVGGSLNPNSRGFLCHYDGQSWTRIMEFPHKALCLRAKAADKIWVGVNGELSYRFDGSSWTSYPLRGFDISAVDFIDFNAPFAVEDPARLLEFRNGMWEVIPGVIGNYYQGWQDLRVVSDHEMYLKAMDGSLLLYDGSSLRELYIPSPYRDSSRGRMCFKGPNDIWFQTATQVVHYDGVTATEDALFPYLPLPHPYGMFGFPDGKLLLLGAYGSVVLAEPYTPTATPTPSLTPTPSHTPTPSATPSASPTGTPTALSTASQTATVSPTSSPTSSPPFLLLAGYWDSRLASTAGGTVNVVALSPGADTVEFATGGVPSGVGLPLYGPPEDGVFWLQDQLFPAGVPSFRYLLELQADLPGASSTLWPYLTVGS